MLERMLSAKDVAEVLGVQKSKAYDIMHSMPYMESPLRVTERALREYIESKTVYPMPIKRRKRA